LFQPHPPAIINSAGQRKAARRILRAMLGMEPVKKISSARGGEPAGEEHGDSLRGERIGTSDSDGSQFNTR
jgi:hypothetical protein